MRYVVFGNVVTIATFRVGAEDAEWLEKEFTPEFLATDLVNLPKYNVYLKLMIDGIASHPFSAHTLPPPKVLENSNRDKIIQASRDRYGIKREIVEGDISRWTESGNKEDASSQKITQQKPFSARPQSAQQGQGQMQQEQKNLYDAVCSNCGKNTKVIFAPDPNKPVYCKSCLKKMKNKSIEVKEKEPESKTENVPFRTQKNNTIELRPKRKEINLADLKKAIDESLEHSESKEDSKELEETKNTKVEDINQDSNQDDSLNNKEKRGIIKPGEKVIL